MLFVLANYHCQVSCIEQLEQHSSFLDNQWHKHPLSCTHSWLGGFEWLAGYERSSGTQPCLCLSSSARHGITIQETQPATSFVNVCLFVRLCDCARVCALFSVLSCKWLILTCRILTECWAIPGGTRPRGRSSLHFLLFSLPLRSRKSESSLVLHVTHLSV